MTDNEWDRLLKIRTTGRDDTKADQYRYPYEPTPYAVLERLAQSGEISKKNVLLDYGCGKGRVDFFMSYQTGCRSIGVEYDDRLFGAAGENLAQAANGRKVSFEQADAADFTLPTEVDRCFFFNPFSIEIFRKVMARIRESYYEEPRQITLFFYYPSDEYIAYLMNEPEVEFCDEIDCGDLFAGDGRERIMIFTMG